MQRLEVRGASKGWWNFNFRNKCFKNSLISNLMKIRLVGAELFHADIQTDWQIYFAHAPKNSALAGSTVQQCALTNISDCSRGSRADKRTTCSREFLLIFQTNVEQRLEIRSNSILICHFQRPFHPVWLQVDYSVDKL